MRIIKFPKLIEDKETQNFSLRNCSVVIDGHNYLQYMYEKSGIPFIFGCETNKYSQYLKRKLKMFKDANVKCFIIFKGGDTDIGKKINKMNQILFDVDTNCEFIHPVFVKDATVQFVIEMGLEHAFCVTETKDDCVALALKLDCPIISYDIEYCFRKAAYIPSTILTFDEKTSSIQCRLYKLQDLIKKYSLTDEQIAIFAALTDSAVFPLNYFDSLLETWGVSINQQYNKLKELLLWFSKHSEQEARAGIEETLSNDDDRNKFWLNYHNILTNMKKVEGTHVTEYLLNSNLPKVLGDPEWFEKGVVCKHVAPAYINLYKSNVIEGSWVVYTTDSRDNLLLSIDIVKYAYNLLTNYKGGTFKVYQDANNYIEIETDDPNVRKPSYNCNVSVFEDGWNEVKNLKLFEHFLTENDISIEVLAKLQPDCVVLFIALVYFARKKQFEGKDVTGEVYAVVLSYAMQNFESNEDSRYSGWKEYLQVTGATAKYYHHDEVTAKIIFDEEAYTRLVELQYCIQHMNYLNTLCGSTYKSAQYRKFYEGTFIFKMFCDIRDKGGEDFVIDLFQETPSVLAIVKDLFQIYRELLISK